MEERISPPPQHLHQPSLRHFLLAFFFIVLFFILRFFLDKFVFNRLSLWLIHKPVSSKSKLEEATKATIEKCSESLWKLSYYLTVESYVLWIIHAEPWLRDLPQCFANWPNHELREPLKLFYMCQFGFYMYSIVALAMWETRRKDFSVMMSHHIITSLLIGISYILKFFRIGAIILALHDASDVFMEMAKIFKYAKNELGASLSFGMFAISWLLLRLVYYPFWVIRASSFDILKYVDFSSSFMSFTYYIFNTMLIMLLFFHMYWWLLICSMIMKQLRNRGKVGQDIRSDSEDD